MSKGTTSQIEEYGLWIDGTWLAPTTRFESIDPTSGKAWATMGEATLADVDLAVGCARKAFTSSPWREMSGYERSRVMNRLADLLDDNAERLGMLESRDNGKLARETVTQTRFAARQYRYFAGLADKLFGRVVPLDNPNLIDFAVLEPLGVCALVIAWNSPMQLLANKLAPALAVGNTVVVKPSEFGSTSILEFAELAADAGLPAGVFNVITGTGAAVGEALVGHEDVELVSLTGGVTTGMAVARVAAPDFKRLVLELGGKSANVVFADASLERALDGVIAGIFAAAGQTCIAGSRLLLEASIHDEFLEKLTTRARAIRLGDPTDKATEMGPVANAQQLERILAYIEVAKAEGARLVCGGSRVSEGGLDDGFFIQPTIFTDVDSTMRIAREEVFGPVLSVLRFEDEAEAVAIANDSSFGLAAGVWTENISRALRMSRALSAGTIWVNTYRSMAAAAPFGGYGKSGVGRERGLEGLREYSQTKNVMIDISDQRRDPFAIRT